MLVRPVKFPHMIFRTQRNKIVRPRRAPAWLSACLPSFLFLCLSRGVLSHQVREREVRLAGLRDLLFPPEITGRSEAGGKPRVVDGQDFPTSPTLCAAQGPGIRQVQAAVAGLREASLCVVEAIQKWQRAKSGETKADANREAAIQSARDGNTATDSAGERSSQKPTSPILNLKNDSSCAAERDCNHLPAVPAVFSSIHQRIWSTPELHGIVQVTQNDLPKYLWVPLDPPSANTQHNHTALTGENLDPERAGRGTDRNNAVGSVAPSVAQLPESSANALATRTKYGRLEEKTEEDTHRINYLANMAIDTDFIGAPGSALADLFPPDTKLYRNPFVLGHNLDDTLAVFTGTSPRALSVSSLGRERARTSEGRDGGSTGGEGGAGRAGLRMDTERVRRAAVVIVAEDAKERAHQDGKTFTDGIVVGVEHKVGSGGGGADLGSLGLKQGLGDEQTNAAETEARRPGAGGAGSGFTSNESVGVDVGEFSCLHQTTVVVAVHL